MPRLKAKPELVEMELKAPFEETTSVPLAVARPDMPPHQSPALALQANLQKAWNDRQDHDDLPVAKLPLGWSLASISIVCSIFWYAALKLIF